MRLELANGSEKSNPDGKDLQAAIESLGPDCDFAILEDSDVYIQTAVSGSGFIVEYQDRTGHYSSIDSNISRERVIEMFMLFLKSEQGWKEMVQWEAEGPAQGAASPAVGATGGGRSEPLTTGSIKDQIISDVKNSIQRDIVYYIRRFIRKLLNF